jgi:hypothetical protein
LQAARIQAHARRRHATRILRERAEASYATAAVSRAAEVYGFDDVGAVEGAESGRGGGGGGGGGGFFGGVLEAAAASHHDGARSAPPDSPQRRQSSPSKLKSPGAKSPGAKSHGAKSQADGRARPFLVVDTSELQARQVRQVVDTSELQARQVRQVVDTSELQDLAGALGRYYAGRRRRQRALRAAHAVLGAAMISASVEQRTAREIRRAAALRSLRADRFDHLVHEQLMPWVLRKRLAVAAEDFDAAKAYKLLESGVLERRADLDDLERRKAHAVATESYQLAAELKEQSDTLRVQIALLLHRAGSPYTYRGHGAPPSLIDAAGASRGGAAGGGARGASATESSSTHSPSRRGASSGPASPLRISSHARDGGDGCSASPLHPSRGAGSAAPGGFGEAASALRDETAHGFGDRIGDPGLGTDDAGARREALVARREEEAAIARASASLARGGRGSLRPASSRRLPPRPMTAMEQPPQQGHCLIGLAGTAASGLRRAASATAMSARAGGAAPPATALASGASGAGREDLYGQLLAMRRREAVLEAELIAIKTRRRQREAKALGAAKAAAALSPAAARLRDELLVVQRHRDSIAEKQRHLEQSQLRVRPKDLATLQRARELVARTSGDTEEHRRRTEGELSAAQGRIDRLARLQRERLESSHRRRASLQRERLEGRILREELAKEMGEHGEGVDV